MPENYGNVHQILTPRDLAEDLQVSLSFISSGLSSIMNLVGFFLTVSQNKSSIWPWHPLYQIFSLSVKFSVSFSALLYNMEKALLFSEVQSDFPVVIETGVEAMHWVAFVAGDGEAPSLGGGLGVEAEAAVDNDGVAAFGKK